MWTRVTSSAEEEDAADLRDTTEMLGVTATVDCCDRERVTVHGSIKSVTMLPSQGSPSLEAELYDGSGSITLVWLGRRRIHGIECGRTMSASGLVSVSGGRRAIYNPRYELDPAPDR